MQKENVIIKLFLCTFDLGAANQIQFSKTDPASSSVALGAAADWNPARAYWGKLFPIELSRKLLNWFFKLLTMLRHCAAWIRKILRNIFYLFFSLDPPKIINLTKSRLFSKETKSEVCRWLIIWEWIRSKRSCRALEPTQPFLFFAKSRFLFVHTATPHQKEVCQIHPNRHRYCAERNRFHFFGHGRTSKNSRPSNLHPSQTNDIWNWIPIA